MADIRDRYIIQADTSDSDRAIRQFQQNMGRAFTTAGIGAVAFNKLLDAGIALMRKFTGELEKGFEAALEYEKTNMMLRTALKKTGQDVGFFSKKINEQTANLEDLTGVSDEVTRRMNSMAIAMGVNANESMSFVTAAISLSNATGKDLNSAFEQILKTLGGFGGELSEVLPSIKGLTQEQLKAGEAAKQINKEFGAFLELSGRGLVGKINLVSAAWDSVAEGIAQSILGIKDFETAIGKMALKLRAFEKIRSEHGLLTAGLLSFFAATAHKDDEVELEDYIVAYGTQEDLDLVLKWKKQLAKTDKDKDVPGGPPPPPPPKPPSGASVELDDSMFSNREFTDLDLLEGDPAFVRWRAIMKLKGVIEDEEKTEREEKEKKHQEKLLKIQEDAEKAKVQMSIIRMNTIANVTQKFANQSIDILFQMAEGEKVAWDRVILQFLRGTGTQLLAQGQADILKGISRGLSTYGWDPTATGLVKHGALESAVGTGMIQGALIGTVATSGSSGGGGRRMTGSAGAGGSFGSSRSANSSSGGGGGTTINVYGALTDEETVLLLEKAQRKTRNSGL